METFECPRTPKLFITPMTCVARIRLLKQPALYTSRTFAQKRNISRLCDGCEAGLKHYQEREKLMPEKKTCPCGRVFHRREDQSYQSWSRSKYCPTHSEMDSYSRKKDLDRIAAAKMNAMGENEKATEAMLLAKDPEEITSKPALIEPETKPCALEGCDHMCVRGKDEGEGTWKLRKYHSIECKNEARRRRKRGKSKPRRVVFDKDTANEIAHDAATSVMSTFAAFLAGDSVLSHDQIKTIAIQAGIESQRRAAGLV